MSKYDLARTDIYGSHLTTNSCTHLLLVTVSVAFFFHLRKKFIYIYICMPVKQWSTDFLHMPTAVPDRELTMTFVPYSMCTSPLFFF